MYIRSFWAKGYRSLRNVRIEPCGAFNVFYGKNGAGKSNILSAMGTLFALLERRSRPGLMFRELKERWGYEDEHGDGPLQPEDRCNLDRSPELVLGATLEWDENATRMGLVPVKFNTLTVEIGVDWETLGMRFLRLETDLYDLLEVQPLQRALASIEHARWRAGEIGQPFDEKQHITQALGFEEHDDGYDQALRRVVHWLAQHAFALVSADRYPHREQLSDETHDIPWLLAHGHLKKALHRADRDPDRTVRTRLKQLQDLLQGPPLHRPPFDIIELPGSGLIELREAKPDSPYEFAEVPLDLAGLGIAQIYSILGSIMLQPARAVGIEEPEAHLHAKTTGRHLRDLLERMVKERSIDQLFIATHSNLFDLDPSGYFDVSDEQGKGTVVARKDLLDIDKDHLYEPGPAKHALLRSLRYADESEIVFRRDGAPVTVGEMIKMLQEDDELAVRFLEDVHGAAVRAVGLRNQKEPTSK